MNASLTYSICNTPSTRLNFECAIPFLFLPRKTRITLTPASLGMTSVHTFRPSSVQQSIADLIKIVDTGYPCSLASLSTGRQQSHRITSLSIFCVRKYTLCESEQDPQCSRLCLVFGTREKTESIRMPTRSPAAAAEQQ